MEQSLAQGAPAPLRAREAILKADPFRGPRLGRALSSRGLVPSEVFDDGNLRVILFRSVSRFQGGEFLVFETRDKLFYFFELKSCRDFDFLLASGGLRPFLGLLGYFSDQWDFCPTSVIIRAE